MIHDDDGTLCYFTLLLSSLIIRWQRPQQQPLQLGLLCPFERLWPLCGSEASIEARVSLGDTAGLMFN